MIILAVTLKRRKTLIKKMRTAMEMNLVMVERFKLPLNLRMVPAKDSRFKNTRRVCHLPIVLLQAT